MCSYTYLLQIVVEFCALTSYFVHTNLGSSRLARLGFLRGVFVTSSTARVRQKSSVSSTIHVYVGFAMFARTYVVQRVHAIFAGTYVVERVHPTSPP